jgi:hypothetical protein
MRTNTLKVGLVLAVAGMLSFMAQPAHARPHGGSPLRGLGKALSGAASHHGKGGLPNLSRAIRGGGGGQSQNLGNLLGQGLRNGGGRGGSQNLGNLLGQGLRNGGSGRGGSQNLGSLLGQGLRNGNIGNGQILQSLIGQGGYGHGGGNYNGGYGGCNNYGGGQGYGDYGYGMPQAYRDVGIANAVVGLVGIAAQTAQTSAYYNGAYAQPVQRYYNERVLVSPSRYETTQVWVPESFDPRTGAKIGGGFYENRTQLVPEVYEERMVPAPVSYGPAYGGGGVMAAPMPPVVTTHGASPWGNPAYGPTR